MKTWENADIMELNINETTEGGKDFQSIDKLWTDKNTGDLYASFASGGDTKGDEFEVIK